VAQWEDLIGKKIVAFRGYKNKPVVELQFVLFDDKESYLEFNEQDQYDYHDCNSSARTMHLWKSKDTWARMFNKEDGFDEPTRLGCDPF